MPSNLDRAHLETESSLRASGVRLQISSREYWRRKSEKDILQGAQHVPQMLHSKSGKPASGEGVGRGGWGWGGWVVKSYQNSPSSERWLRRSRSSSLMRRHSMELQQIKWRSGYDGAGTAS